MVLRLHGMEEVGVRFPVGPPALEVKRWGGRVVEGGSLENCYTGNRIVSSNLTPTASSFES